MLAMQGQIAVVTGAARGVGRAMALALAERGASVVCAARSTAAAPNTVLSGTLEETVATILERGGAATAVPADVSTTEGIDAIVAAALEGYGRCDILLNNAAVSFGGNFASVPVARWRKLMEVNLLAPVALLQALLPSINEVGGVAISYSSRAATSDEFSLLPYSVSKVALERLTQGLAAEAHASRFVTLRIDDVVPTEAVTFHGGPVAPDALSVEDVVNATLWLIEHADEHNGETVSLIQLHARLAKLAAGG